MHIEKKTLALPSNAASRDGELERILHAVAITWSVVTLCKVTDGSLAWRHTHAAKKSLHAAAVAMTITTGGRSRRHHLCPTITQCPQCCSCDVCRWGGGGDGPLVSSSSSFLADATQLRSSSSSLSLSCCRLSPFPPSVMLDDVLRSSGESLLFAGLASSYCSLIPPL